MRALVAVLLLASAPAWPAQVPAGCGTLCGSWQLDAAHSDPAEATLDQALAGYRDPRPKRTRHGGSGDPLADIEAGAIDALGPIHDRPGRDMLRDDLLPLVRAPQALTLAADGKAILIRTGERSQRKLSPGEPHSRVDAEGTAKIRCTWQSGRLVVSEVYDRKRRYTETFELQRADGSLVVTREIERPGLKALRVRFVYRPG